MYEFGGAYDSMLDAEVDAQFGDSDNSTQENLVESLLNGDSIPLMQSISVRWMDIDDILDWQQFNVSKSMLSAHKEGRENIYHDIYGCLVSFVEQNWKDIKRGIKFENEEF